MDLQSLKINEVFDISFTGDGMIALDNGATSVANMIRFGYMSNDNWELDSSLGMHWVASDDSGMLQSKDNELFIVSETQRKIENTEGVKSVESIKLLNTLSRKTFIQTTFVAFDDSVHTIENKLK